MQDKIANDAAKQVANNLLDVGKAGANSVANEFKKWFILLR